MRTDKTKYFIGLILTVTVMILWAIWTWILTEGRNLSLFSAADNRIFIGFLVVEFLGLAMLFFCATRLVKGERVSTGQPAAGTKSGSGNRGVILVLLAYGLGLGTNILGVFLGGGVTLKPVKIPFWICTLLPLLLCGLSVGLRIRYLNRLERKSVAESQQFLLSHREQARETAAQKLRLLARLRNLSLVYSLIFPVLALGTGVLGQMLTGQDSLCDLPLTFWSSFLYLCALHRIHFPTPAPKQGDDPLLATREDYPELYALAEECARSQGWEGQIVIRFADNCNAGVHKDGKTCSIYLGVLLLNILSREELQAVFCHEFHHVVHEQKTDSRVRKHYEWLAGGGASHLFSGAVDLFYELPDAVFTLEFQLYRYAQSLDVETEADQAMITFASREAAASMLMKLKYYDLFQWEEGTYDTSCDYANETPNRDYLQKQLELLKSRMLERQVVWQELFHKEIMARSATHPTAAMRVETLGVTQLPELSFPEPDDEARKALAFVAQIVCQELQTDYEEARKALYLEPLEFVNRWEAAGKPVIAEEYADVDGALRVLGRYLEAEALCSRAAEELSAAAGCHGLFLHGFYLLRCYDDAGIELIYRAMEQNQNYIDEGLAVLGEYCCITGNQQELDSYREKAVSFAQDMKDIYDKMGELNKGDQLVPEELPRELHNRLLEYLKRVDEGHIDRVYLVRKVITEEDFVSAVVIRFLSDAPLEGCQQVMDRVFHFLDTCSDWQFALFEYSGVAKAQPDKVENSCIYIHEDTPAEVGEETQEAEVTDE